MKKQWITILLTLIATLCLCLGLTACGAFGDGSDPEDGTHVHDWGEWTVTRAATCTEAGEETRTCKKDSAHKETREVKALGHDMKTLPAREASCAEDGYEAHIGCTRCGYSEEEYAWTPALHVKYEATENGFEVYKLSNECTHTEIVLPSIYHGKPVTSIGTMAFYNCSLLSCITIPDSMTSIGAVAFFGDCSSLESITIPDSVTSIGMEAFECTAYYNDDSNWDTNGMLYIGNHLIKAKNTISGEYTIRPNIKTIAAYAFSGCSSLTSVMIPDSVTSIGMWAFENCNSLTSITIPDGVTLIDTHTFHGCSSLPSITIPDSVTSIGESAFGGCSSLTSVTIPDSVTSIGGNAFWGTAYYNDESNWDASGVLYIGSWLIEAKDTISGEYTVRSNTKLIADEAFMDCESLTSITIPDSVTSIGMWEFVRCSSLESITIPNSVTSIGIGAFMDCESLTSVTIPDSVISIGHSAFESCSSLTSITIPNSVTSIEFGTFMGCESLTSITIPDSVTSIEAGTFLGCSSLTSITIPDSVTSIGSNAFRDCISLTSVIFTNPNGWEVESTYSHNVIPVFVDDAETAAGYLKAIYCGYHWTRS